MNKLDGMSEAFKEAKIIFLTTFFDGSSRSRQMTNFNESPYETMWFPTEINSKKINDISLNSKVLLTFPALKKGEFFEIEGKAELATQEEVDEKWRWWYLYWHPEQEDRFWFPKGMNDPKRAIINVHSISARLVKK